METQADTLDLIVRLASLGTAGISILGIFYTGIIVKSLPNDVSSGKLTAVRMYKNMCIVIAIICALSGVLNAYYNQQKVKDAKENVAQIESRLISRADSLNKIKDIIVRDLSELSRVLAGQPCDQTITAGILQRINADMNSMNFKPDKKPD